MSQYLSIPYMAVGEGVSVGLLVTVAVVGTIDITNNNYRPLYSVPIDLIKNACLH